MTDLKISSGWQIPNTVTQEPSSNESGRLSQIRSQFRERRDRLKVTEEANVLRQLALMLESGLQFSQCLHILTSTMTGPASKFCGEVEVAIRSGHSLGDSLMSRSERLSVITPYLVKAGEESGALATSLDMAAKWAESSSRLLNKIRSAMIYPCFVLLANLIMTSAMLTYVFPAFLPLFAGEELPLLTRFVLLCSKICQSPASWFFLALLVAQAFLFMIKPGAQSKINQLGRSVPVLRSLLRSSSRARFSGVIAVTVRSGLPIMQALHLAAQASGDSDFLELDFELQERVRNGDGLTGHFLAHSDCYGNLLSQGMIMSQETGEIEKVHNSLSEFFESESEYQAERLRALLEPLMMMLVAFTTTTVLLAIFLPMTKFMASLVK